jgi:hypothetical protein
MQEMKKVLPPNILLLFFCFLFVSALSAQKVNKPLKKQLDSMENKIDVLIIQLNELTQILNDRPNGGDKSLKEVDLVALSQQNKTVKLLQDSTKTLLDTLNVKHQEIERLRKSASTIEELQKNIERLNKQIESEKTSAADKAKAEEKNHSMKKYESFGMAMLQSAALIDDAAVDRLSALLDASNSIKVQLETLKNQSQIMTKAMLFLEEGKGVFAEVYEDLIRVDFDKNIYPAQFALQQNIKKRFVHFLKAAKLVEENLEEIKGLASIELRTDEINNPKKFSKLIIDPYPYLRAKVDANKLKNVSLGIDAKYLNIE